MTNTTKRSRFATAQSSEAEQSRAPIRSARKLTTPTDPTLGPVVDTPTSSDAIEVFDLSAVLDGVTKREKEGREAEARRRRAAEQRVRAREQRRLERQHLAFD